MLKRVRCRPFGEHDDLLDAAATGTAYVSLARNRGFGECIGV